MKPQEQSLGWKARTGATWVALVLFAGCVRVPTDAEKHKIETRLISASANGQTTLRWDSRQDLVYTVMVGDRFTSSQWKPLPNAINLRGTGEPIELHVTEEPNRTRTYQLMAVPVQPATKR